MSRKQIPKKLANLGFGRRATPAQKMQIIEKSRQKYSLRILLSIARVARSTYYYHLKKQKQSDKYSEIKQMIHSIYNENKGRSGYRRITITLHQRGYVINNKTVQRLKKEMQLTCLVRVKKYRSYRGNIRRVAPNLQNAILERKNLTKNKEQMLQSFTCLGKRFIFLLF